MPVLAFFAVIGSVLFALLFAADATLENSSPAIVTSQRTGLPAPQYDKGNAIKTLITAPAPAPDMTSQRVLSAQPKAAPNALAKIEARAARAEVPPKNALAEASARHARAEAPPQILRVAQPTNSQQKVESEARAAQVEAPPQNHEQNQFDRFSIKGY